MRPGAHLLWFLLLPFLHLFVAGQGSATLWTSYVPLAVRSPYLSAWMDTTDIPFDPTIARAPSIWPVFYDKVRATCRRVLLRSAQLTLVQAQILGWAGLIRIDNTHTFKWLGDPGLPGGMNRSVLTNIQITPTRTIMNMTSGPIDLTVTFLSPIEVRCTATPASAFRP